MKFILDLSITTYGILRNIASFVKKWSDVLIFLPVVLLTFIFNAQIMEHLDPTAPVMSVDFLSILNFNLVKFGAIFSCAYFVYNLFFHDFFGKGWEKKLSKNISNSLHVAALIHLVLWLSTLFAAYKILTEGL